MADLGAIRAKIALEVIELGTIRFDLRITDVATEGVLKISGPLRLLPYFLWAMQAGEIGVDEMEKNQCETKS